MKVTPDDILSMTHGMSYRGWENTESGQRRVAETAASLSTDLITTIEDNKAVLEEIKSALIGARGKRTILTDSIQLKIDEIQSKLQSYE